MIARRLTQGDYPLLKKWWKDWGWIPVLREALPESGTGGIMIENDGIPICAGFLYLTNSTIAWMEWEISDKESDKEIRKKALELLEHELTLWAEGVERKVLFSVTQNKSLIEKRKNNGWIVDENPSYEMTKTI